MKDISHLLAQYDNKTTLRKESLLGSIIFLTDRDCYYWKSISDNPKNSSCLSHDRVYDKFPTEGNFYPSELSSDAKKPVHSRF